MTSFAKETNFLENSYTFDLATESRVDAWIFNPRYETGDIYTGIPPLTIMTYGLLISDSGTTFWLTEKQQLDGISAAPEQCM